MLVISLTVGSPPIYPDLGPAGNKAGLFSSVAGCKEVRTLKLKIKDALGIEYSNSIEIIKAQESVK